MKTPTPSEFYKMKRPEYFSDSKTIYKSSLTREQLAYELNQISTNQKQDEFETLCRRLAEIFITPNLIPQVGPTGGGDGKTDSETYPVSESIFTKWFVPDNGWNKNEKWAFAISAKQTWKSKAKGDIKKIVDTKREYTKAYFMTNQTVSSKKKKDAQDEFEKEFNIEVIILDGEWILEKIYSNDLIDLVVDSLNLSNTLKDKSVSVGQNDAYRISRLNELELQISNSNRYLEYDFALVEDALESAILSRMLEKSKDGTGNIRHMAGSAGTKRKMRQANTKASRKRAEQMKGGQTSGLATSMVFTPEQGMELVNPDAMKERVQKANQKWFSESSGFQSALPKKK